MEHITAVRRFILWHRRAVAAVLVGLAVMVALTKLSPASQPGIEVVVTTRDLRAGDVFASSDLRITELPPGAIPDGEPLTQADIVGQTAASGVRANSVLQPGMLAAGRLVDPGRALVPVTLTDDRLAQLLVPGAAVTLAHVSESGFDVLTADARVGALPAEAERPPLTAGIGSAPLVLVDVPGEVAAAVSVLGQRGELSIILGGL